MTKLRVQIVDDDTGETVREIPPGNDRMWHIVLFNRRRGNRRTEGTAAMHRLLALFQGVGKRHPRAAKTAADTRNMDKPIIVRAFRGGPVVMIVRPLDGPVASVASKH